MDKILPLIAWIKKNRFWLGSGLLSVAMIGTWFWITMAIGKQTADSESKISQSITSGEAILRVSAEEGVGAHANTSTQDGMKSELSKSLDEIVKAWKIRHQAQQSILKWPTEIIGNPEFVSAFSQFDPPETFPEIYDKGHGLERYRELYRVAIPKQMDKICKEILRTKWNYDPEYADSNTGAGAGAGAGRPGGGRNPGEMGAGTGEAGSAGTGGGMTNATPKESDDLGRFAVVWDEKNQALWQSKLTKFKQKDDHFLADLAPTPLQIYMLQQDLWLLEAMFTMIRQINGDVKSNDLAAIKKIYHVAFGREARSQMGELTTPDLRLATKSGEVVPGETLGTVGEVGGDTAATGPVFDILASYSPYHGRYVTVDFKPIPAEVVRLVLTAKEIPTENLELIVAKRVPVRIALRMDERQIPEFMTACANSPFAFEINQVRLNRYVPGQGIVLNGGGHGADNNGGGGGSGGMGEMNIGGRGGMPQGGADRGGRGAGLGEQGADGGQGPSGGAGQAGNTSMAATPVHVRTSYDVDVEFYGIVKIYNPVREAFLRKALGEGDAASNDAALQKQLDETNTNVATKSLRQILQIYWLFCKMRQLQHLYDANPFLVPNNLQMIYLHLRKTKMFWYYFL